MALGGEWTVLELDGARLTAVTASVSGSRVEVRRWLSAVRPETVAAEDARAVGQWIGAEFRRAGLPRGRLVLAVARGDIVLKQLTLPGNAEATDAEIAGVVRLQMLRQLTMPLEGAVIDYAPVTEGGEGGGKWVQAGAMPAERVRWWREVAKAAGLKLKRIGLRCFGAAALLGELSQRKAGPMLGVAVGSGSAEFVVVDDGQMSLARAADLARPASRAEIDAFADRVAVEARRTWMSYRGTRPGPVGPGVVVLGEGELARRVAERCAASLEAPGETLGVPGMVTMPSHMPESERGSVAPLVGLLLEQVVGRETLDFANPRKLPDVAAKRRQMVMAAVLGLIVLGGGAYVMGMRRLEGMRGELAALRGREAKLRRDLEQAQVESARVGHAEAWEHASVDWMAHLRRLGEELPDPRVARLNQWRGRMAGEAVFTPSGADYSAGKWSSRQIASFDLAGEMDDRHAAEELRDRLLAGGVYTVDIRGADVPDSFALELTTRVASPPPPKGEEADARPESPGPAPAKGAKRGGAK